MKNVIPFDGTQARKPKKNNGIKQARTIEPSKLKSLIGGLYSTVRVVNSQRKKNDRVLHSFKKVCLLVDPQKYMAKTLQAND
ncbi:MAG: hypothetical protein KTR14_08160 [Vampirovibrio sp.]|nr:hypothetical protein [Vampirovibrio sp.]